MLYKVLLLSCPKLHNVGSKCMEMEVVVMAGHLSGYVRGSSGGHEDQKVYDSKIGKGKHFWILSEIVKSAGEAEIHLVTGLIN